MVQISLQNLGEKVVFLRGSMDPFGHKRKWKYFGLESNLLIMRK